MLSLSPTFNNGVAVGTVNLGAALAGEIRAKPEGFYVNVHTSDFPAGAVRGQLSTGESVVHVPVVADVPGLPPSLFRTAGTVTNFSDVEAEVWAEWYPASRDARSAPVKVQRFAVPGRGTAVFNNLVAELFAASGRGAVRMYSPAKIAVAVNIFNDQRPAGGTFGQFAQGLTRTEGLTQGVLPYNRNQAKTTGSGWRTNFGWSNPSPQSVTLQVRVVRPDGSTAASKTVTLQPWSNDLLACGDGNGYVPSAACSENNFTVAFSASSPVFLYSSVVDNITDDGLYQPAQAAPEEFVNPPAPGNNPPTVSITSPASDLTVSVGQTVNFTATASDPDGDSLTVAWNFGDGVTDTTNSLSVSHAYAAAGTYTATVTVSDGKGGQAQASRQVTVQTTGGYTLSQLQTDIFTPRCSGCHPPTQGLDLSPGQTYGSTVNVPSSEVPSLMRVKPGDPDNSYLYRKIRGVGISGARMPQGGPFLSQSDIDKVKGWIEAGAPNNWAMPQRFLWFVALLLASGCGERKNLPTAPDGAPPDPNATFTRVLGEVFVPSCAKSGCHAGQAPQAGLNLEPAGAYANVVRQPSTQRPELWRVAPFEPQASYLVKKIRGDPDIVGSPMPAEGNISAEARQLIVDWVRRGAPRD